MKVEKVINNNLIRAVNEQGQEIIVMGCGLGFQKKVGDDVDQGKIEKIYKVQQDDTKKHLEELLAKVPLEHIQITNEIIEYAKLSLGKPLPENIYITLTDHISFAIQRIQNGVVIQNALLWEIKRFYNHEYQIGLSAVEMLNDKLSVDLPEDEAGFIALHFVCASMESQDMGQAKKSMKIIQNILNIVKYHFQIQLKEDTLAYERFITHLKFFVQRVFSEREVEDQDQEFMLMIKAKYKNEYACSLKIYDYFLSTYNLELTNDEMMYLTIHIYRVTSS